MSLPGIEPGALSVVDSCDNHYTTDNFITASDVVDTVEPVYYENTYISSSELS